MRDGSTVARVASWFDSTTMLIGIVYNWKAYGRCLWLADSWNKLEISHRNETHGGSPAQVSE